MSRRHLPFALPTALLALAAPLAGYAEEPSPGPAPAPAAPSPWRLRASLTAYTAFEYDWINDSPGNPVNPGNAALGLPREQEIEDLRPILKLDSDIGVTFVAKPRLLLSLAQSPSAQHVGFDWIEAYGSAPIGESLNLAIGAQNYQWGPAELYSPSNEFFPFFLQSNTPLFYLRGRNLFRMDWTPSSATSATFLAEYAANGDPTYQADRPFAKKAAVRGETTVPIGPTDRLNAALVVGTDENQSEWLGQYALLSLGDAWAVYFDASENFRATGWYPVATATPDVYTLGSRPDGDRGFFPRVLTGAKYVFRDGDDVRLEYFHNGLGWSREQYQQALGAARLAVSPAAAADNASRLLAPGIDFLGQNYLYASLRIGDLGHRDRVTWFFRYLHSLTDQSGSAIVSAELTPAENWAVIVAALASIGPDDRELTQLERLSLQAALRLSF